MFNAGMRCEAPERYASSTTAPPVRVPEGMSVPDESQALQIPPGEPLELPSEGESEEGGPCLEQPPRFFDDEDDDEDE